MPTTTLSRLRARRTRYPLRGIESEKNRYTDVNYSLEFMRTNDTTARAAGSSMITVVNSAIANQFAAGNTDTETTITEPAPEPEPVAIATPEPESAPEPRARRDQSRIP